VRHVRSLLLGLALCLLLPAAASAAQPSISVIGSDGEVGGTIHATATLGDGENPTGTIEFEAFGPNDPTCAGAALFTDSVAVAGNGQYISGDALVLEVGSYRWSAKYSGDGENDPVSSLCVAVSTVAKATPGLTSAATNGTAGGSISDTATLAGGFNPTGTLTFKAFGPNDPTCSGAAAFSGQATVSGNGNYGSGSFVGPLAGSYRWTIEYSGDPENAAATSPCNAANETSTVGKATPAISTTATNGTVGGAIKDTATISAGVAPTGSVVFKAFGPGNATCAGAAAFTKTVTVSGNASYDSTDFATTAAGTYRWTAEYSGDANNNAASSACNAPNETSTVGKATPTLSSVAANGTAGGTISDSATLATGFSPTGTLTFEAFGPNDPTCGGAAAFTKTVTVAGNANYGSTSFTNPLAGSYRWTIEYSGDANNNAATSGCNAANETSTVGKVAPTLSSTATNGTVGGTIKDTATVSAGISPTGSLVFKAFGPNDANCTGVVAFTKTVTVSGNASYDSTNFATTAVGAYRWTVEYSGDANNGAATSGCNAANEISTVSPAAPTLNSTATNGTAGGTIKDTATLASGFNPTGTLTFNAYGPSNPTCAGAAAFTKAVTVAGNGGYDSTDLPGPLAGSYNWTISYSGDANNNAVNSGCNAANETSTVAKVTPTLSSTATNGTAGGTIKDTATLASGFNPTGTLTFKAFGPNDPTCAGTATFTKAVTVSGNKGYDSTDFSGPLAGSYRWTIEYSGDVNNNAATSGCNAANETSTVAKASPGITPTATNGFAGGTIKATATLASGASPTGQVVFKAFAPADGTCATAVFNQSVSVNGNGGYTSPDFTPTLIGNYRWTIEYSGDANNSAVSSSCTVTSSVGKASPVLASIAANAIFPGPISDNVTLAAGFNPTGNLTFKAFGPENATCTGAAAFTKTVLVNAGNGSYGSTAFEGPKIGTYRWTIEYSGDANNNAAASPCNAANETSTVAKVPPALSISTGNTAIGGAIASFATFGGGLEHTGQVDFRVYGPTDPTCAGAPSYVATVPVTPSNNTYASGQFTPPRAGAFRWTATYSGDEKNAAEATPCAAAVAAVAPAAATLTPQISAAQITIGDGVRNTVAISGGFNPTGTVTFNLYGPGNTTCSGSPAMTSTATVSGNGSYGSAPLAPGKAGDYRFTVAYSGDDSNSAVAAACGSGGQYVQVLKRTPTLKGRAAVRGKKLVVNATLAGAQSPRGKISFRVYAPGDKRCTRKPVFSSQAKVTRSGNYSAGYRFERSGLYYFSLAYSGDERNSPVKKGCATRGQSIRVP
jgi:hypothetical protein